MSPLPLPLVLAPVLLLLLPDLLLAFALLLAPSRRRRVKFSTFVMRYRRSCVSIMRRASSTAVTVPIIRTTPTTPASPA